MGADLYAVGYEKHRRAAEQLFDAAVKKRDENLLPNGQADPELQAQVDKAWDAMYPAELYFRDSYNPSSVMWRLDLSWWGDVEPDVKDNDEINCSPAYCLELAKLVESRELKLLGADDVGPGGDFEDTGGTVEEWNRYFIDKKKALVRFLKTCANEGGMYASL